MQSEEVRKIIQEGWSNKDRVQGWVESQMFQEYCDGAVAQAWENAFARSVCDCKDIPNSQALDIGTGPGTIARFWCQLGFVTTGVDFSPAMLEAAKIIAAQDNLFVRYEFADAENIEYPESSFDVISSRFLVFTLTHPGYAMRQWVKLLKPGGRLIMVGHDHPQNPQNRGHHKQKKRRWQASEDYRQALQTLPFKNHTSSELRVVMEALGLQDIQSIDLSDVITARQAVQSENPELQEFSSIPFILSGRRD